MVDQTLRTKGFKFRDLVIFLQLGLGSLGYGSSDVLDVDVRNVEVRGVRVWRLSG
jgi:hypothetical protein